MNQTDRARVPEELFAEEEHRPFRLAEFAPEDYVVLGFFWLLAIDVFLQFFSRYVIGDSIGWTEEMARYLLIAVGFLGGAMAVRRGTHIMIEFLYDYLSPRVGRALAMAVDVASCAFFLLMTWLTFELARRTGSYMVSVDVPKSIVYFVAGAGFALMALRGLQATWHHWRHGMRPVADGGAEPRRGMVE